MYFIQIIALFSIVVGAQENADPFSIFFERYVDQSGKVAYQTVQNDSEFQDLLEYIATVNIGKFSNDERLAFYINSYNVLAIKNVADHWPIHSPMDVSGFFKNFKFLIAGEELSLDDIEYKKIFPMEDVLVHFGLVCAAMSCPRLLNIPFRAPSLTNQLIHNAHEFLQDTSKNKLDKSTNTFFMSEIFKWFRPNFVSRYGSLLQTAQHFVLPEDSAYIAHHKISIDFLKYDWTLNSQTK